jgi:hypothetical protein
VLVYAFLINKPKNEYNAIIWLDRVTSLQYLRLPLGVGINSEEPAGCWNRYYSHAGIVVNREGTARMLE